MVRPTDGPAGPESAGTRGSLVRFGPFEASIEAETIWSNGSPVRLQQQPFHVLAVLLEHAGELVTREELRERLWPDDVHVDFEHSLNTAVKKVRLALRDSLEQPRYVETVRGRGYRFVAPVERIERPAGPRRAEGPGRRARWLALGAAAAAAAAAAAVTLGLPGVPDPPSPRIVPLTSYPGREYQPTFSPDGSHLAFVWWRPDGNHDIYVQLVGVPTPRRLTEAPEIDHSPAWSPDGRWIAFIREPGLPDSKARLIIRPPNGGRERVVAEYPGRRWHPQWHRELAWPPDGRSLVLSRRDEDGHRCSLYQVDVADGRTTRLTESPERDSAPTFSPDGRTLAFSRRGPAGPGEIYLLPLAPDFTASGAPQLLVGESLLREAGLGSGHMPAWTPDGEAIVFVGTPSGPDVYRVNVSGAPHVERIPAGASFVTDVTFSPRMDGLAFASWQLSISLVELDLAAGSGARPHPAAFSSTWFDESPAFSPDGETVAFASHRGGWASAIWLSRADGSGLRQLTSPKGSAHNEPAWSPDGQWIAFTDLARNVDLHVAAASGSGEPRRLTFDPAHDGDSCWSPDGRWIYFTSTRQGMRRVWRLPAEGGSPEMVTRNEGSHPALSPDGRLLYFARGAADGMQLWRMPVGGSDEELVLDAVDLVEGAWHVGGDGIYFFEPYRGGRHQGLFLRQLTSSRMRRLADVEGPVAHGLAVSPDGRTVLYAEHDDVRADLNLLPQ